MSLQPHWYSTIFPVILGVAQVLSAMAFAIAALSLLAEHTSLAGLVGTSSCRDLGNLLLTFVMFWTYTAFSQFLLIWVGNLPEETVWYLPRFDGGWKWIAVGVLACQFALPFVFLLFRRVKDDLQSLRWVAFLVLATSFVNLLWQIVPAFEPEGLLAHWLDIVVAVVALVGVGGRVAGVLPMAVEEKCRWCRCITRSPRRWPLMADTKRTERPELGHETTDASFVGVLSFAGALVVLGVVILVAVVGIFRYLVSREPQVQPPASVFAASQRGRWPPAPRLEGMQTLGGPSRRLVAEQNAAQHYGWVDRSKGIVRIPVDDAMQILADKLPSRPEDKGAAWRRTPAPGASNSGRDATGDSP